MKRGRTFVGRGPQLDFLDERARVAVRGTGSIVLVGGDAGIGKSRLVEEFHSRCEQGGFRAVTAPCFEYARSPFAPFLHAFRRLGGEEKKPTSMGPDPGAFDKLEQFEIMSERLRSFGAQKPLVIAIEDVHWADSASLELLQYIAPVIADSQVMIVATFRTDEPDHHNPLRPALSRLQRRSCVFRIDLDPLNDADIDALLHGALGRPEELPAERRIEIRSLAEGNPLVAEELLRSALDRAASETNQALPMTLKEAVLERLAEIDEPDRGMIFTAAVIGRSFRPEFLARIAGCTGELVVKILKRAVDLHLIAERAAGELRYEFRHALSREVVYGELLTAEARPLHAKIAAALELRSSTSENIAELAYHCWQARDKAKAAQYSKEAGDHAFELFAYRDAVNFYRRAVSSGGHQGAARAGLLCKLGAALQSCQLGEQACRAYSSALEYYDSAGDSENAAKVCVYLARMYMVLNYPELQRAMAERALELVSSQSAWWFAAHVEMALWHTLESCDALPALEHLKEAEKFSGELSPKDQVMYFERRAVVRAHGGDFTASLDDIRKAVGIATTLGDEQSAARCWGNYSLIVALAGNRELALEGFDRAFEIVSRGSGRALQRPWVLAQFAYAYFLFGELQRAKALVEPALDAVVELPQLEAFAAGVGAMIGLRLEDADLISRCARADLLDRALRFGSSVAGRFAAALADSYIARGAFAEAKSILHRTLLNLKTAPAPGDYDWTFVLIAAHAVDADLATAGALFRRTAEASKMPATLAHLALFDAHLAGRAGDMATKRARALEASTAFGSLQWPYFEAQALELAGEHEAALERYRRIGDTLDVKRLESLLFPLNRRGRAKGGLTPRETEIVESIVSGKSNRAIAEALVLSERTVESHVSSIFSKFNVSSRAELLRKLRNDADLEVLVKGRR